MRARLVVPPVLVVPGRGGAGPGHWQTLLERKLAVARRVELPGGREPRRADWVAALEAAVADCAAPPLFVAHALGCIAVAHWAAATTRRAAGALLVAPCDVDAPRRGEGALRDFAPVPRGKIEFPSLIAASSDDPGLSLERAGDLAHDWGAHLRVLGARGGLDAADGYGPWLEGEALLAELICRLS